MSLNARIDEILGVQEARRLVLWSRKIRNNWRLVGAGRKARKKGHEERVERMLEHEKLRVRAQREAVRLARFGAVVR